ncbi:NADH dehydrogenase subunit I [Pseudooceanicola batsensis HTCC2597]|uniref:NADH dehydrogenase subunit I n=1 Tax=Pseudooceanicola batsensis (strain ATCC BAA-863 / DSM 15984 / KCTC 12145 / HTCC2597) TaxID=252305 RepID=A3U1N3_PSEBH|nr:hypothetical protein [Pseudooceanicola batsensis]EAQ01814.1 NADH dehydrogenase subunit I [Pseudooceanicola batsensis HTCC2597]
MSALKEFSVSYDYLREREKYAFLNAVLKNLGVLGQRTEDGTDLDETDLDEAIKEFFDNFREDDE